MPAPLRTIAADAPVQRWVMFAAEFLDPVTRQRITEGLRPKARGLAPPLLNRSGRFVWRLAGAAAERPVHIDLEIDNKMYGQPVESLDFVVKANDGTVPPDALLHSFTLTTTALYRPPAGMTAATGRVLKGGGSADPMPGVEVVIEVRHDSGSGSWTSTHPAISDTRGEFAAVLVGLSDEKPDPHPTEPCALDARLTLRSGGDSVTRVPAPPLRRGRLTYLTVPVEWADPP